MSGYQAKRALLSSLIDYAGQFPPAALPFEKAVEEAVTFRREIKHPWIYNKFAMPMADLKKITPKLLSDAGGDGTPLVFTALGSAVPEEGDASEYARVVEWDLRELRRFNERGFYSSYRYWVHSYETKFPAKVMKAESENAIADEISLMLERFVTLIQPYFEIALGGNLKKFLPALGDTLASWKEEHAELGLSPGIKIRTGGARPPTSEELAEVVSFCTSFGFRFKATQGLHHAVTTGKEYGFVNLFGALTLSQALGREEFGVTEIMRCLETTDAKAFGFSATAFSWGKYDLDLETIEAARRKHAGCFGSCSLKEPDESLATTSFDNSSHK